MLQLLQRLSKRIRSHPQANQLPINYERLYKQIGYRFVHTELLEQALKHRSVLPALNQSRVQSNERLELLGDAVLGLLVTEFLFKSYPEKEEGELTAMKSLLVSRKILAGMANELDLGSFLLLSDSEIKSGGRHRQSIVADALEALIGAIYLDSGLEAARQFIVNKVLKNYEHILNEEQNKNFKSILLEYAQSKNLGAPFYIIRSEDGPDHNKVFTVEVKIQNKTVGVGVGNSKKRAEQKAAQNALEKLDL
ncbi:MAG: ribonuclease III [Calditrichaeota bacterium]|nr:MAG: ribonuclease III [Calditrichota bacterium]